MNPVRADDETVTAAMLESLYLERYPRFLAVARGALRDHDRAHDAVQETFARAVASRERLHASTLTGWLWRVLTNLCLSNRQLRPIPTGSWSEPPADEAEEAEDEWTDLRAAVAALPERQRLTVFLRHYADLDYNAIAELLGVERGTVAATLNAAHMRLRATLALERKG